MKEIEEVIRKNLRKIRERIDAAAKRSGQDARGIVLVVVSKFRPVEAVQTVIDAGIEHVGESRVQEAEKKRHHLTGSFTYRMIGHLQRNKAVDALRVFDSIDSVDSLRLARKLSEEAVKSGKTMPILIEVNTSGEQSKCGFHAMETAAAVDEISALPNLQLCGLMTIGPLTDEEKEIRCAFETARRLFEKLRQGRAGFDVLSMGMTDDFEIAIEEGSNMVRIGRAVFEGG